MANQDWKTGELSRKKYVIHKPCRECDGTGRVFDAESLHGFPRVCKKCNGEKIIPVSDDAQYFVLRIDCGSDGPWDPNARKALLHYAECVRGENPIFADDILRWLDETLATGEKGKDDE